MSERSRHNYFSSFFQLQTISCKLCKTKNKVLLWKKPQVSKKTSEEKIDENTTIVEAKLIENKPSAKVLLEPICNKKPKKKRKRDKNAGLLYSVNKDDNSVKAVTIVKQKFDKLNIQKPTSTSSQNMKKHQAPNKSKSNAPTQSKVKTKNTAKKGGKSLPQRNNLLQLANALKSQGSSSGSNSPADKLKQLLR